MSARAIRKLREDREAVALAAAAEDEESDSEEEDLPTNRAGAAHKKKASAFAMMNDSSSSSSESDGGDDGDEDDAKQDDRQQPDKDMPAKPAPEAATNLVTGGEEHNEDEEKQEENLDALLEEFKEHDDQKQSATGDGDDEGNADLLEASTSFQELLAGMDVRDLDVDYVMRTSLLSAEPAAVENNNPSTRPKRRNRQVFLFGNPRDLNLNTVKPPHYVGGGIGMSTYDRESDNTQRNIPWPYSGVDDSLLIDNDTMSIWQDRRRWFTFLYADSYEKDCQDFRRIQESGDMNALVLFVAHHPFVVEALVTLGLMLYQVNQAQEGLTFLRRSLWVYESATLPSFSSRVSEHQSFLMDCDQPENKTYFDALFRSARVNNMAGLSRSSFATGRYLLSMDPLRDPRGILLALDHYALDSNVDGNDQWLVDLVKGKNIPVLYRDQSTKVEYTCELLDLPNWAYSYALALFRLNDSRPNEKSNQAIQNAISRFPSIVDRLLSENDVDITSRSCRLDWQAVMDYTGSRANAIHGCAATDEMDPVVRMATDKAYDLISRVFAKLNHKLWASDAVMLWMHSALAQLKKSDTGVEVQALFPAMMRYSRIDPGDYETKFQLLPAEANPLDPTLVHHALVIDPNRRRFLRAQRGGRADMGEEELFMLGQGGNAVRGALFGPPRNNIDLDWPMLEIFWRSLLPWNRIDEIPRPRP